MAYIDTRCISDLSCLCLQALHTNSLLLVAFEGLRDSFNVYLMVLPTYLNVALQNEVHALVLPAIVSDHNHYLLSSISCTLPPV